MRAVIPDAPHRRDPGPTTGSDRSFDGEPVVGPAEGRTRRRRPGTTASAKRSGATEHSRENIYEKIEHDRREAQRTAREMERRQSELVRARAELASIAFDLAILKLQRALARKYRADQPRVPAGNPEGGQFTNDGSGSGRTRLAQGDRLEGYPVDLREEDARGGHTIPGHVGKSHEYLLNEIRDIQASAQRKRDFGEGLAVGSFTSLDSATRLVNSTIAQGPGPVAEVARGAVPWATIHQSFNSPTGYEAYARTERSQPYIRDTYGVSVHLRPDPSHLAASEFKLPSRRTWTGDFHVQV